MIHKHIYIVTTEPFPIGMAATNRIISYGKGFIENDVRVKVICLKSDEREEFGINNHEIQGDYYGIKYEYVCGTTRRGNRFYKRRLLVLKGVLKAFYLLFNDRKNIDAIILYTSSFEYIIFFYLVSRILSITYIHEKSEFPVVIKSNKKSIIYKIYAIFYVNFVYKLFDAILAMTGPLMEYYKTKIRKSAKLLQVPMTVETERFSGDYKKTIDNDYIAYCGSLDGNKDGVPILIESFALISTKFKDISLVIIGDAPDSKEFNSLRGLSKRLGVEDRVIFTGRISRDEVPGYLCNAKVLALARPTSLQAAGGFPSKLGEYLSTGNPVVVTKVGDIPIYLKNCESSFIAEPDSATAFAEKLEYVLSNPDIGRNVGQIGRQVAFKYFDYQIQAKRIINLISELK